MVAPRCKQVLTILKVNPINTLVITEKLYDLAGNEDGQKTEKLSHKRHSVECYNQMWIKFYGQVKQNGKRKRATRSSFTYLAMDLHSSPTIYM